MEQKAIVKYQSKDGQEIQLSFELIRSYLVSGKPEYVTAQEMMIFIGICKARGLNPFARDCWLIKYTQDDPAAIVTSIDYFRARAKAQVDCHGWEKGIIVETKDGEIKYSKGLLRENEKLIGGWFRATPSGWKVPFELEVNLKGYLKKRKDGNLTRFWQPENQPTQIAKVAESQGLRSVWPAEFQQIYEQAEMPAGEFETAPIDITGTIEKEGAEQDLDFDEAVKKKLQDYPPENRAKAKKIIQDMLNGAAEKYTKTVDQIKMEAAEDFEINFWSVASKKFDFSEEEMPTEKPKRRGRRPKSETKPPEPIPEASHEPENASQGQGEGEKGENQEPSPELSKMEVPKGYHKAESGRYVTTECPIPRMKDKPVVLDWCLDGCKEREKCKLWRK